MAEFLYSDNVFMCEQ